MMLGNPLSILRKSIRNFVAKRQQRIVLEELWSACKYRFYEDGITSRKDLLIEIIQDLAAKELEENVQWLKDQRNEP